uniref:Uncharacterized protein n=1 Tax=Rhizophora mucronata TaxID=61149 RepID=A0A2P2KWF5_RHIMU
MIVMMSSLLQGHKSSSPCSIGHQVR